jgi:hypothetical protein
MVALLRDGLNVSLDDFAGGGAASPLTAYDSNDRYKALIAALEQLPRRDRDTALTLFEWAVASRLPSAIEDSFPVPIPRAAESVSESDVKRLSAIILRMDEEQQRRFFEQLAAKDTYEILQIRSSKHRKTK